MRARTPRLQQLLSSTTTARTTLVRLTRTDGLVMGFTTLDRDIVRDGVTYHALGALRPSDIETKSDMSVGNMQLDGVLAPDRAMLGGLDSPLLTEADVLAGLWDDCRIDVYECDWREPEAGAEHQLRGTFGEVVMKGSVISIDVRSLAEALQKQRGRLIGPQCDACQFDKRCGLERADWTWAGVVTKTDGSTALEADILDGHAVDYWKDGRVVWKTGANRGEAEIRTSGGRGLTLHEATPAAVAVGDRFEVHPGCRQEWDVCRSTFNNRKHFRGFPGLPGRDAVLAAPDAPPVA